MKKHLITSIIIIIIIILIFCILFETKGTATPITYEDALELYNIELNNVEYID